VKFVDLTGKTFGRLTAIRRVENKGRRPQWLWSCACGNETVVAAEHVKSGHTESCGCLWKEKCVKHGHGHDSAGKQTRTYKAWVNMRSRVDPSIEQYRRSYADKGITVCARWNGSFINFLEDMGECPEGKSLDRIDNDGNYEPGNCRWATRSQQGANTRRTVRIDYNGEELCLKAVADRAGIHPATLSHRINTGRTLAEAISYPVRKRGSKKFSLRALVLDRGSEWMMY
jgi:hypothetical protein